MPCPALPCGPYTAVTFVLFSVRMSAAPSTYATKCLSPTLLSTDSSLLETTPVLALKCFSTHPMELNG